MDNNVNCPSCKHQFQIQDAMRSSIESKIRQELNQKWKSLESEQEEKFRLRTKQLESENEQKLQQAKKVIEEQEKVFAENIRKKVKEENQMMLASLQKENDEKNVAINNFRQKEIGFLEQERQLKERAEGLELEKKRFEIEIQQQIEEKVRIQEKERNELRIKDYEMRLEQQKNLISEMQRKAEQGSTQLQGEVQELAIEEMLQRVFPFDEIQEVGKGIRGADAIQLVRNEMGQECGKIIFESKRTQNFGGDWIDKLKDDQRNVGADIAVLVTQTMPKDMDRFGEKEGVWVCNYVEVKALVHVLRKILIRTQSVQATNENRTDKASLIYSYVTSQQFIQQITAIAEGFKSLKDDLDREKRAMQKIWKEREIQIEKVLGNTIDIYGSIKGMAGSTAIASIQMLELPE